MTAADIEGILHDMARWEPDAVGRLQQAALELYAERGYEQTTVAEIAGRAGLSERTYFRHFADKREVLFGGSEVLQDAFVTAIGEPPAGEPPLDVVAHGLRRIGAFFDERREPALVRNGIVRSSRELQERELMKRDSLVTALAAALRRRGVDASTAGSPPNPGSRVFHVAFERWVEDARGRPYAEHVDETLASLRALAVSPAAVG